MTGIPEKVDARQEMSHHLMDGSNMEWTNIVHTLTHSIWLVRQTSREVVPGCTITEKAPTRAGSWLKVAYTALVGVSSVIV